MKFDNDDDDDGDDDVLVTVCRLSVFVLSCKLHALFCYFCANKRGHILI